MRILDNDIDVDVIGFGALNVDKLFSVENIACKDQESFVKSQKDTPGGSAANTIIGLSRLNRKTSIIGKIAEDDEGEVIELNLAFNGVYTNNLIYSSEGSTGKVLGFVDSEGNRALYVDAGVNDEIKIAEINPRNVNVSKIMHYTSFVGDSFKTQIELLDDLKEDMILSFDPGMIYVEKGLEALKPILERTNILLINESELRILYDDLEESSIEELAKKVLDSGIETVVVKKGSEGVYATTYTEKCDVPAFKSKVVDTTGAGDSFNSGFLYGQLNGFNLEQSCILGNFTASKAIEAIGMENFPTEEDLKKLIDSW